MRSLLSFTSHIPGERQCDHHPVGAIVHPEKKNGTPECITKDHYLLHSWVVVQCVLVLAQGQAASHIKTCIYIPVDQRHHQSYSTSVTSCFHGRTHVEEGVISERTLRHTCAEEGFGSGSVHSPIRESDLDACI